MLIRKPTFINNNDGWFKYIFTLTLSTSNADWYYFSRPNPLNCPIGFNRWTNDVFTEWSSLVVSNSSIDSPISLTDFDLFFVLKI